MFKGRRRRITCIDFGGSFVKTACVEVEKEAYRLLSYDIEEFDTSSSGEQEIGAFILRSLKKCPGFGRNTFISISGPEGFFVKKMLLAHASKDRMISLAKRRIKAEIPFDCEDILADLQIIRESPAGGRSRKAEAYCLFVKKDTVDKYVSACRECGLVPRKVSTSIFNYCGILGSLFSLPETSAVLDIGNTHSYLSIYRGSRLSFAKSLDFSVSRLCGSLCGTVNTENGDVEIDFEKAERLVRSEGLFLGGEEKELAEGVKTGQLAKLMLPLLEKVSREVWELLSSFASEPGSSMPETLYITGGGAGLKNAGQYFNSKINIKVEKLPLPGTLDIREVDAEKFFLDASRLSSAIGLAMRYPGINLISMELRKGMFRSLRLWLVRIFLISALAVSMFFWIRRNTLIDEQNGRAGAGQRAVADGEVSPELSRTGALLEMVGSVIPAGVALDKFEFDRARCLMRIGGTVSPGGDRGRETLAGFIGELENMEPVLQAKLSSFRRKGRGSKFEIECSLRE
ncbi:MAG: pilus assembly protein PilM [Candidatus Omnitrophica bacterium]|nr:pilus assembly protein PilM [Candidatus Omnitrophota bacterium]